MSMPGAEDGEDRVNNALILARNMRNNGASIGEIESRMIRRGLSSSEVKAVMARVPVEEPDNIIVRRDPTTSGRMTLVVIGVTVSALGLFLAVSNRTGVAPSLPLMGVIFMVVGGVIAAAGRS